MKAFKNWLKAHGLCPCCWIEKMHTKALLHAERCAICAMVAAILSALPLGACAEEKSDACGEQQPAVEQQYIAVPSARIAKVLRIPCPQNMAVDLLNANERLQAIRLAGNPYATQYVERRYTLW